jgi:UDPglucose 6-dehydrogenase
LTDVPADRAFPGRDLNITVIGLGYVGLVTAACLADWGHRVTGVDADEARLTALRGGNTPFHEPGLERLVHSMLDAGRLQLASHAAEAVRDADIVILAVGTHDGNGGWQTKTMLGCLEVVVPHLREDTVIVIRSTLPPDFVGQLGEIVDELRPPEMGHVSVILNPEFTREGRALDDFRNPSRVVLGVADDPDGRGRELLIAMYQAAYAPVIVMSAVEACLAKLGSNLFLATKITFANEMAALCDAFGGAIDPVVSAIGLDPRIAPSFLGAGIGFGGSCLPHQVSMISRIAESGGVATPLFAAVDEINHRQRNRFVDLIAEMLDGRLRESRIALLGLAFKPDTDDIRDAPSIAIARALIDAGADVVAYDPMPAARSAASLALPALYVADSVEAALRGADAVALVTEWPELVNLDWAMSRELVRRPIVVDGRNALDHGAVLRAGFRYAAFGRGRSTPVPVVMEMSPSQRPTIAAENARGDLEGSLPGH